jgi:hypothetical protein
LAVGFGHVTEALSPQPGTLEIVLFLQQGVKTISFFGHDEPDGHPSEKLVFGPHGLLCHAHDLPKAKTDVWSLFDKEISLNTLPNSDERTLARTGVQRGKK